MSFPSYAEKDLPPTRDPSQERYLKRDMITGTREIIVDRDAMIALNKDNLSLLRDIRKLLNHSIPADQLLPIPEVATVANVTPVRVFFKGNNDRVKATLVMLYGSADFYFDFDRPATINSPLYKFSFYSGAPLIFPNIEIEQVSILAAAAGPYYINAFMMNTAPNANFVGIRAFAPAVVRDDIAF